MAEPTSRPIQLRYFAWVREKIGRADEMREPPKTVRTVGELMSWLSDQGPEYQHAFAKTDIIRIAIDQKHVHNDATIAEAKEIAFFPPVTGG